MVSFRSVFYPVSRSKDQYPKTKNNKDFDTRKKFLGPSTEQWDGEWKRMKEIKISMLVDD